jgi:primase-polymerase (primpol)-like protein
VLNQLDPHVYAEAFECEPPLFDTYAENSPSGLGIKIWAKKRMSGGAAFPRGDGRVEIYDHSRNFTLIEGAAHGKIPHDLREAIWR